MIDRTPEETKRANFYSFASWCKTYGEKFLKSMKMELERSKEPSIVDWANNLPLLARCFDILREVGKCFLGDDDTSFEFDNWNRRLQFGSSRIVSAIHILRFGEHPTEERFVRAYDFVGEAIASFNIPVESKTCDISAKDVVSLLDNASLKHVKDLVAFGVEKNKSAARRLTRLLDEKISDDAKLCLVDRLLDLSLSLLVVVGFPFMDEEEIDQLVGQINDTLSLHHRVHEMVTNKQFRAAINRRVDHSDRILEQIKKRKTQPLEGLNDFARNECRLVVAQDD